MPGKSVNNVFDILEDYAANNPEKITQGITSLKSLYDLSGVTPDTLADKLDDFYKDPANSNATLAKAVTAAKNEL